MTNLKKYLIISGLLMAFTVFAPLQTALYAAPANPHPAGVLQSNGDEITIFHRGDEFFHWFEDEVGNIIVFDYISQNWRYAEINENGQITATDSNIGSNNADRIRREALLPLIASVWRINPEGNNPKPANFNPVSIMTQTRPGTSQPTQQPEPTQRPQPNDTGNTGTTNIGIDNGNQSTQPNQPDGNNNNQTTTTAPPPATGNQPAVVSPPPGNDNSQPLRPELDGGNSGASSNYDSAEGSSAINPSISPNLSLPRNTAGNRPSVLTNQRLLVLLIEFNNLQLIESESFYANKYFGTAPGTTSVVNYFRDMSGGLDIFVPATTVSTIPQGNANVSIPASDFPWARNGVNVAVSSSAHNGVVTVRFDMNHPVTDWNGGNGHAATRAVVSLALQAINETSDFNFSGNDLHFGAIFAGGEASDFMYNPGGHIWAHAWQFDGSSIGIPGWPRYMAYGERQRNDNIMGIGISVHELGHVLGLPDLYDITGASEGIGPYSVMAHGSWGRAGGDASAGHRPTAFDAWSKIQLGYVQPIVVSEGSWQGVIESVNRNQNILRINSPVNSSQYFLLENRQMSSTWDAGLGEWISTDTSVGGIMVFHIDDSMHSSDPNDMNRNNNNRFHKMVDVVEADGSNLLDTSNVNWRAKNDHFFSAGGFAHFNPTTNPPTNFHDGSGQIGGLTLATGIEMVVLGERGDSMEISVNFPGSNSSSTGPLTSANQVQLGLGDVAAGAAALLGVSQNTADNDLILTADATTRELRIMTGEIHSTMANRGNLIVEGNEIIAVFPNSFLQEIIMHPEDELLIRLTAGHIAGSNMIMGGTVDIILNDKAFDYFDNPYFVLVNTRHENAINPLRISAVQHGRNIGGDFDTATGEFSFSTNRSGEYRIAYIAGLSRLNLQLNSNVIQDLVDDVEITMDVIPVIVNNRIMVPVRFLAESLGAEIQWDEVNRIVRINLDNQIITMTIGEIIEGMDTPAEIINGRTMVPLRFVAESFGAEVRFDADSGSVSIVR
ncbi:MAG: stalk domain-containing protein [Defluviitaleaceae bacterium]|nr:stalk domain-containing protein [Defluviitaleaceae bacterium]